MLINKSVPFSRIPAIVVTCLMLSVSGCVWFDFPDDPQVTRLPDAGDNPATITIVRKKQFSGSGTTQSIMLNQAFIVNLQPGQYTTFQVPAGRHVMVTAWRIGGLLIGFGGVLGQGISDFYKNELTLDCMEGQHYYLTLEAKGVALHDSDRIIFTRVERLQEDFSLDDKTFVPAGR